MKVGLVILNYKDYESTLQQVERVKAYQSLDHIIVVDNYSPNESYKKLKEACDGTWDLIQTDHNGGYGFGNNTGIRFLTQRYAVDIIGIANPDVFFSEDLVRKLVIDFTEHPEYAVITGIEKEENGRVSWGGFWKDNAWIKLHNSGAKGIFLFLGTKLKQRLMSEASYIDSMLQKHDGLFSVDNVVGSLFFARAEDFLAAGGFDENIFLYKEEDVLSQEIRKLNKKIGIDPTVSFVHVGNVSIGQSFDWKGKRKLQDQSDLYFFRKYVTNNAIWCTLFRIHLLWGWTKLYLSHWKSS